MTFDSIYKYCLAKKGIAESFPFNETALTFKVGGKVFAIFLNIQEDPQRLNLKCDPEYAVELRSEYEEIQPGYHMNKKHWNTVTIVGELPSLLVKEMIDHSYDLVFQSLSKAKQKEVNEAG